MNYRKQPKQLTQWVILNKLGIIFNIFYICKYICKYDKYFSIFANIKIHVMTNWNDKAKRLLKSELIKRGISNAKLAILLKKIGVDETKASIDSKICRGSFSASFLLQCLYVIGCNKFEFEGYETNYMYVAEQNVEYKLMTNGK